MPIINTHKSLPLQVVRHWKNLSARDVNGIKAISHISTLLNNKSTMTVRQ